MEDPPADLPDVPSLRTLEPPPGGLPALRAKLDADDRRRRWWFVASPVVAFAAIALWLVSGDVRSDHPRPTHEVTITRHSPPPPPPPVADPAISDGDVQFYWVASERRMPTTERTPTAIPMVAQAVPISDVVLSTTP